MQKINSLTFAIAIILANISGVGVVFGQNTCATCQKEVQSALTACRTKVPSPVKPKDPRKETDEERKAASDRLEKSRNCSTAANEGFANCRRTAGCP